MADELRYRDATGKTVTVTIDGSTGTLGTAAVSETSGLYRASMPSASAGFYWLYWENTTDSTVHREQIYWNGTAIALPQPLTSQQTRDSLALPHTNGTAGVDKFLRGLQALVIRR